jgi:hypothetical protein
LLVKCVSLHRRLVMHARTCNHAGGTHEGRKVATHPRFGTGRGPGGVASAASRMSRPGTTACQVIHQHPFNRLRARKIAHIDRT